MPTAACNAGDQVSMGPSEVPAQSKARMRRAMSLLPARKPGAEETGELMGRFRAGVHAA